MTRRNLSGPWVNSSTLCDRSKPASTDRKDQPSTGVPPDQGPARPQFSQPGGSDSGTIGTGDTAESPEHTHVPAGNHVEYNNPVAGPGVNQFNGDIVTASGASPNSTHDGLSSATRVYNKPVKIGPGNQHNGFIYEFGEDGTLKTLSNSRVIFNNPICVAGPFVDGNELKIVGSQHNGCIIKSKSAPVKDRSETASS